mmetsp:Transcript_27428/g.63377  ORF Transcript_27428/g.63377 Transcript_27428/m.63377 type:complete len:378 (+) Transcript_27428:385-1518(+)
MISKSILSASRVKCWSSIFTFAGDSGFCAAALPVAASTCRPLGPDSSTYCNGATEPQSLSTFTKAIKASCCSNIVPPPSSASAGSLSARVRMLSSITLQIFQHSTCENVRMIFSSRHSKKCWPDTSPRFRVRTDVAKLCTLASALCTRVVSPSIQLRSMAFPKCQSSMHVQSALHAPGGLAGPWPFGYSPSALGQPSFMELSGSATSCLAHPWLMAGCAKSCSKWTPKGLSLGRFSGGSSGMPAAGGEPLARGAALGLALGFGLATGAEEDDALCLCWGIGGAVTNFGTTRRFPLPFCRACSFSLCCTTHLLLASTRKASKESGRHSSGSQVVPGSPSTPFSVSPYSVCSYGDAHRTLKKSWYNRHFGCSHASQGGR